MSLEDKDFAYWFDFFKRYKPSLAELYVALDIRDTYYLNNPSFASIDDVLYEDLFDSGFIEGDFRKIWKAHEETDVSYYQARIAMCLFKGMDLRLVKEKLNTKHTPTMFEEIIEGVVQSVKYMECGIDFPKLMTAMFNNKSMENMNDMLEWGFMHGVNLGEKYGENFMENEDLLNSIEKFNTEVESLRKDGLKEPENPKRLGVSSEIDDDDDYESDDE